MYWSNRVSTGREGDGAYTCVDAAPFFSLVPGPLVFLRVPCGDPNLEKPPLRVPRNLFFFSGKKRFAALRCFRVRSLPRAACTRKNHANTLPTSSVTRVKVAC